MKNKKFHLVILLTLLLIFISIMEIWGISSDPSHQSEDATYRAGKKDDPTAVKFKCSCPVYPSGDCYCKSSHEPD